MNKIRISSVLTVFFVLTFFSVSAQERFIQGMVTTFDSIPLNGAEVEVVSTKAVAKTDSLGKFSVQVNREDKLKVRAKGFYTQKVELDGKIKMVLINLKLKPTDSAREYAIGYGYVKDADKLNAVVQMTNKDVDFSKYTNMLELMRGRFGGVQVNPNGDIIIRGVNSINSSSAALIVVDGVMVDGSILNSLAPSNVKSINIIKDGSAAIYGARGGNGVVVIETKRGNDD
ncbi:TonB-dependent receptor plug domain-containing protein [Maribellus sp. YY47]|uniref:TonB-dependent receptor plug domain-containing protein n=1 Tax=Maribellus sp. YY47 TaxID=2929486 RepID=UPI002001B589|nr:TonB-dependent receptor plug domain-containing protein [Maribellus sp. YY47]MCK3684553.1 TonB-dependent receptor plug domain-containing protein [Maribellus sp. YY47]